MPTLEFNEYEFDKGTASKADLSPVLILFAKKEGDNEFVDASFYPLSKYFDIKSHFMREVRQEIKASETDDIVFMVERNDLPSALNELFFDADSEPTEALFQFGQLDPHVQDVVACYVQTEFYQPSGDVTLQDIVIDASHSYLGKFYSKGDYARHLFDEDMFNMIDGSLDINDLALFVDFDGMGEYLTTQVNDIEIINYHFFK